MEQSEIELYNNQLFELYKYAQSQDPFIRPSFQYEPICIELIREDLAVYLSKEVPYLNGRHLFYAISQKGKDLIAKLPAEDAENPYGFYLKLKEQYNQIEEGRKKLQDEKLDFDLRNAKRIYHSYWWTFMIAIAGFIIALILLILKLKEINSLTPH